VGEVCWRDLKPKNIVLLGCTGSIGVSTQKVAADLPDLIRIIGVASRENVDGMEQAIRQFKPRAAAMTNRDKAEELKRRVGESIPVHAGERGLVELATMPEADIVLVAIVGTFPRREGQESRGVKTGSSSGQRLRAA